jgi:creatinine amidohydrolase/Fe(II)-dependent formamide hydrolase-like protein
MMLHLRPDLVYRDRFPVPMGAQLEGSHWPGGIFGTITPPHNSLGSAGTSDDASRATAEWGARLLDVIIREVAATFDQFYETAGAWFA